MNSFQPVNKSNRLAIVDALRGLALLGILIANVPVSHPGYELYQTRGFIVGSPALDELLEGAFHLLVDKKFITIFSILFGFGFYIQVKNAEKSGINFRKYFLWRMGLLFFIGCFHAYIFWFGDILRDYAICGACLLFAYKWSSRRVLTTAVIFIIVLTASVFTLNGILGLQNYSYDRSIAAELLVTHSYSRYLEINATIDPLVNFIQDSPITLVFCFGNMMLGVWLAKTGFFQETPRFKSGRNRLIILGATFGIVCSYLFWEVTSGKLELTPSLIWLPLVIVGGLVLQSLFYISLFIKGFQYEFWKRLLSVFAPVGRMALTNYLLQTLFYLIFFFHWLPFSNFYGKITITETYLLVIILFATEVAISNWWLRTHDHGPLEKIWKDLSYRFARKTVNAKVELITQSVY